MESPFVPVIPPGREKMRPRGHGRIQCDHAVRQSECDLRFAEGSHSLCLPTRGVRSAADATMWTDNVVEYPSIS